jgi:hypothetical protein
MTQGQEFETASVWQRIFLKSKVNGAPYEEQEPDVSRPWPEKTYLQRRLDYLRSPDRRWQTEQTTKKEITDAEAGRPVILLQEVVETPQTPIYIDLPSDDWTWCANPSSDGKSYAT